MGEDGPVSDLPQPTGPLDAALSQVGDRWTLLVVNALLAGPRRFNDLADELAGIAPNVLSQRLKRLEGSGLVVATPYSTRPPRVTYDLTASGRELAGVLRLLAQWGGGRTGEAVEPLVHADCGTALEARWWCPTCRHAVDDDDASGLRFV
jgi:DNA-binding HxlR family transcriptional regulator